MWTLAVACLLCDLISAEPTAPQSGGPRLTEDELFAMLDLSQPELAGVAQATRAGDRAAAKHALASHFRVRTTEHWFEPLGLKTHRAPSTADRAMADRGCAHLMESIDQRYQFGPTIDWLFDATRAPGSDRSPCNEWTWQLNRHAEWVAMAHVYRDTGDEKYVREFAEQLRSWATQCPRPTDDGKYARSAWRTIETGIRAAQSWPEAWNQFVPSPSLSDDDVLLFLRAYLDHALHLMAYHGTGNWLAMEAAGLYTVGALFPEFKDAPTWRATAAGWSYAELAAQVYPDGVQFELASEYHHISLDNFLLVYQIARLNGYSLPGDYLRRLESMYTFDVYGAMPNRCLPPVQDSPDWDVRAPLATAFKLYPGRRDFQWYGSDGQVGHAPAHTSWEFPYAGYLFMRSDWRRDACALMFDVGPFGYGHQHEDKLQIIVDAFGARLLVDPGVYEYEASKWRALFCDSPAHNVVLVDGQPQRRAGRPREDYVVNAPESHVWETTADHDYAEGYFTDPFAEPVGRNVSQTRRVLFVKPDLWFILDSLTAQDDAPHTYDALFHFGTPDAHADGVTAVTLDPSGANLQVAARPDAGLSLAIVKGQDDPLQGWLPNADRHSVRPAPCAVFRQTGRATTHLLYALAPCAKGEPPRVASVKPLDNSGLGAIVAFRDGKVWRVLFSGGEPKRLSLDGRTSTGRVVWSDGDKVWAAGVK